MELLFIIENFNLIFVIVLLSVFFKIILRVECKNIFFDVFVMFVFEVEFFMVMLDLCIGVFWWWLSLILLFFWCIEFFFLLIEGNFSIWLEWVVGGGGVIFLYKWCRNFLCRIWDVSWLVLLLVWLLKIVYMFIFIFIRLFIFKFYNLRSLYGNRFLMNFKM